MAVVQLDQKLQFNGTAAITRNKPTHIRRLGIEAYSATATTRIMRVIPLKTAATSLNASATVVNKPIIRRQNAASRLNGSGIVNITPPVRMRRSRASIYKSTAETKLVPFTRIRHSKAKFAATGKIQFSNFTRIKKGVGSMHTDSSMYSDSYSWRYITVRSSLSAQAKFESYYYDYRNILQDVRDYLPKYYNESMDVEMLTQTVSNELIRTNSLAYHILDQFFPQTATWGLDIWERHFDIEVDYSRSMEERRAEVIERISGFYYVTLEILQYEAEKFFPTEFDHQAAEQCIYITILDKTVTEEHPLYKKFIRRLTDLIPCHLDFYIRFKRTTWGELKYVDVQSWQEVNRYAWGPIKTAIFPVKPKN